MISNYPAVRDMSPEQFLEYVADCRSRGWICPAPESVSQLQALCDRWPELGAAFLPPRRERHRLGLMADVKPFDDRWKLRLLETIANDAEFRDVLVRRLGVCRG